MYEWMVWADEDMGDHNMITITLIPEKRGENEGMPQRKCKEQDVTCVEYEWELARTA